MLGTSTQPRDSALQSFPKLEAWFYEKFNSAPRLEDTEHFHLFHLAKALHVSSLHRCRLWTNTVEQITSCKPSFLQHILDTDSLAVTLDTSVTDLYALLAELAVRSHEGKLAFLSLAKLADQSQLAAFRFLSAWVAFNMNDLSLCISECEKVSEPFAPIHTLLGQALLETGKSELAIEALKAATQIAPSDPLPLVQLVKAYLTCGLQAESMSTIDKCRKLVGNNIEIECLASMTIATGKYRPMEFCEKTLGNIASHLASDPTDIDAFTIGIDLATELDLKDWARQYAEAVDLSKIKDPRQIGRRLSAIIKKSGEKNWYDISKIILDKAIALTFEREINAVMQ